MEGYEEIKAMAKEFADKEVAPRAREIDSKKVIPAELLEKAKESGFFGINIPEAYGGSELDIPAYCVIIEEISKACASTSVLLSAHNSLCVAPIMEFGTEDQKKKYLPKLATGEMVGCFCLSEPNAGSDAGSLTTQAVDKGDYYEVSGVKNFITNGKEADLAIVFAKTTKTENYRGISAFIIETKSPGFSIIKLEEKLGICGSSTAQIAFDKVKVPKENLLGNLEKGFRVAMSTLDGGRVGIAAQAIGIGMAAFTSSMKYTNERVQFDAPLSSLQGVQFILADMSTKLAASRGLMEQAAKLKEANKSYTLEAAQAKLFSSETAMWVTTKAIQICGGAGFTKDYSFERYFRDAKITEIYEGASEIQRLVIASNELKRCN